MRNLAHNEALVRELLQTHWARYDIKPDDNVFKQSIEWAKSLDEDTLRYALDPANHYKTESGRPIKPRLVDLENVANNYRDARGDFYRPPLPDTSLLEEPKCLYCADGDVYDFVFEGNKWNLKRTGTCAVCSGGMARGNPVFVEMAKTLNTNVGKIVWQFSLALLEYKFKCGLTKITKTDIEDALGIFRQKMVAGNVLGFRILPDNAPLEHIAPTKPEIGIQVRPEPEMAPEDDFIEECPGIPF